MKRYIVTGAYVTFHSGVLELTEDQHRRRDHALKPLGDGLYKILKPTGFKQGEEIGYDGEVPKALMNDLTPPEEEAEKQVAEKEEEEVAPPEDPKERLEAIVKAIGELDANKKEDWTSQGQPTVAALEDILGYGISGGERNEAYMKHQESK